jgi:hypothetical protein
MPANRSDDGALAHQELRTLGQGRILLVRRWIGSLALPIDGGGDCRCNMEEAGAEERWGWIRIMGGRLSHGGLWDVEG